MAGFKGILSFLVFKEITQLLAVAASSALLAAIILYTRVSDHAIAHSVAHEPLPNNLKTDASTTIATIRTLQGVLAAISSAALVKSFTYLYWILLGRADGVAFASLLASAPSTTELGRFRLLFASTSSWHTRILGLVSILATALLWVSGLVLFLRTSLVVVYDTAHSYEVVAGVGQFNASLVDRFIGHVDNSAAGYQYRVLPYSYYSVVYNLITNSVFSNVAEPVDCHGPRCTSYVLSGGVMMAANWQPIGYDTYPLLQVPNVPVIHVDFDSQPTGRNYTDMAQCDLFGEESARIGARLCLTPSVDHPGAVEAGIFVCTDGVRGGACNTQYPTPNLTTTMTFYGRQADILASRSNSSVMLVSGLTTPSLAPISEDDLAKYRSALRWLLDYSAANIPAPSSIIESFWTGREQLATDHMSYGYLAQHFHSILSFPLWFFNANNYGNIDLPSSDDDVSPLPVKFLTEAHIVAPHTIMRLNLSMIIVFAITQGLVVVFTWVMLAWAAVVSATLPRISSYPLFDILFKTAAEIDAGPDELRDADDSSIEKMVKGSRVHRKAI